MILLACLTLSSELSEKDHQSMRKYFKEASYFYFEIQFYGEC